MAKVKKSQGVVPRLQFSGFERKWVPTNLGKICDMQAGKFVSAADIQEAARDGLYPCFGGNGLRGYTATYTHDEKVPLIGRQGALCGNVTLASGKFHATEHAVVARPKPGVVVDWLYYVLYSLDLNRFATGQAQPGLSVDVLEKLDCLKATSESEQKIIADCLSSLDTCISAESRKLDALKVHKQSLMQQLFPAEGQLLPRLRFPGFEGEWRMGKLSDVTSIKSGATPLRSESKFYKGGTIPWVKTTDLTNSIIYRTEECITEHASARVNAAGSVLVAMYGGFNQIGRTGYLNMPAATNQAISVLSEKSEKIMSSYLLVWLNAKVEYWKKIASSSRKDPNITGSDVANFPIGYPSKKEQKKISDCLFSLDEIIAAQSRKIATIQQHKKGLMQGLFPAMEAVAP